MSFSYINAVPSGGEKYSMIILPLAIEGCYIGSLTVGDAIAIDRIEPSNDKIRVSSENWVINTRLNLKFRKASKLLTFLSVNCVYGTVFAIFKSYILVELALETRQFHFCN
jgi:hypothetical protein